MRRGDLEETPDHSPIKVHQYYGVSTPQHYSIRYLADLRAATWRFVHDNPSGSRK
jgi:hypothetical protein